MFRQAGLTKRPDARGREVGDNGGIRMSSSSRAAGPERRIQETFEKSPLSSMRRTSKTRAGGGLSLGDWSGEMPSTETGKF